jgi:hypothetical protein
MSDLILLSPAETALLLRTNKGTLANWRSARKGPAWTRVGNKIRYQYEDVQRYVASGRCEPEQQVAVA